jgi:hypothetical protein
VVPGSTQLPSLPTCLLMTTLDRPCRRPLAGPVNGSHNVPHHRPKQGESCLWIQKGTVSTEHISAKPPFAPFAAAW